MYLNFYVLYTLVLVYTGHDFSEDILHHILINYYVN